MPISKISFTADTPTLSSFNKLNKEPVQVQTAPAEEASDSQPVEEKSSHKVRNWSIGLGSCGIDGTRCGCGS